MDSYQSQVKPSPSCHGPAAVAPRSAQDTQHNASVHTPLHNQFSLAAGTELSGPDPMNEEHTKLEQRGAQHSASVHHSPLHLIVSLPGRSAQPSSHE